MTQDRRVLGLYATPEAAAQVRDAELRRLDLHDLVRLNEVSIHQIASIAQRRR
jgi:hypothetical protein